LIAVYGLFITPIGWTNALWIWLYALVWFFFNDAIKVMATRFLLQKNHREEQESQTAN
jgi:H+-transporting ATPase